MQLKIFPNGDSQIESELNELHQDLNRRFDKKYLREILIHASAIYYVAGDKSSERITKSIIAQSANSISNVDSVIIYKFLQRKFNTSEIESAIYNTVGQISNADKYFFIAKGGIVEVEKMFLPLESKGKFEAILLNSYIILDYLLKNEKSLYLSLENEFYANLINQAKSYKIDGSNEDIFELIVDRLEFYSNEIKNMANQGYLPNKIYFNFYLKPLSKTYMPQSYQNGEIMKFYSALITMVTWVIDSTKEIK
jgi:hypothetical protein